MPAHNGAKQVGVLRCGDGELLTEGDVRGNAEADRLAKKAVQEHRVGRNDVNEWIKHCSDSKALAIWIARATHLANNSEYYPFKDSEASRSKAEAASHTRAVDKSARAKTGEAKPDDGMGSDMPDKSAGFFGGGSLWSTPGRGPAVRKDMPTNRPREQGGHVVVREVTWGKKTTKGVERKAAKMRSGWRCTVCRAASANKEAFELEKCKGSARERQLTVVSKRVSELFKENDGHRRVYSGTVEWCHLCGCFTENRCKGLSALCTGIPKRGTGYGGMWGQRRKLL